MPIDWKFYYELNEVWHFTIGPFVALLWSKYWS